LVCSIRERQTGKQGVPRRVVPKTKEVDNSR